MSGTGPGLEAHLRKIGGRERMVVMEYAQEVCAMRDKVDPADEHDWASLWTGYALGKGLSLGVATDYRFYMDNVFPLEGMDLEDLLGPLTADYRAYLEGVLDPRD